MHQKYTIAQLFIQNFNTMHLLGFDKRVMYEEIGTDFDLYKPDDKLPIILAAKSWEAMLKRIPADEICFRLMERFSMAAFGVAGYVIINSPDAITAFRNFCRYSMLHSSYLLFKVVENEDDLGIEITLTEEYKYFDRFLIELNFIGFVKYVLECLPEKYYPVKWYAQYEAPIDDTEFKKLMPHTEFIFGADKNLLVYPKIIADKPMVSANSQLYMMFDKIAEESLLNLTNNNSLANLVRKELSHAIKGNLPGIEEIAERLNMSARNLQLKLKNENTSFRELTDEVRKDIAVAHLKKGMLNISEIAYLLGFSEVSSFSSAFKKWTGVSPTTFVI